MVGSIVSIVGVQSQNKNDVFISLCIYTLYCILVRETFPTSHCIICLLIWNCCGAEN